MPCRQLPLNFSNNESSLRESLHGIIRKPLKLTITNTATAMITVSDKKNVISIRLNRIFLNAGTGVLEEVAAFIKRKKGPKPKLRQFINDILIAKVDFQVLSTKFFIH